MYTTKHYIRGRCFRYFTHVLFNKAMFRQNDWYFSTYSSFSCDVCTKIILLQNIRILSYVYVFIQSIIH